MSGQQIQDQNGGEQAGPVLVIGATGKTGRRVAQGLKARGHGVREASRSGSTRFDWHDESTWRAALRGARAIYIAYSPDLSVPEAPGHIRALTEMAKEEGVGRIVLMSGRGEKNAERSEQIVRESGLAFTLVRAAWFAQNFSEGHLVGVVHEGVMAMPAGTVREPFVDVEDIADVAVAALTEDGHEGELYDVTGPELLSFDQVAKALSRASGREVSYVPVTAEAYREGLIPHVGVEMADLITAICRETLDGRNEFVGDGVRRALGREARSFGSFCESARASGCWDGVTTS